MIKTESKKEILIELVSDCILWRNYFKSYEKTICMR